MFIPTQEPEAKAVIETPTFFNHSNGDHDRSDQTGRRDCVHSNSESSYPDQWLANERAYLSKDGLLGTSATEGWARLRVTYHQVFRRDLIMKIGYDEFRVGCGCNWSNRVVSFC